MRRPVKVGKAHKRRKSSAAPRRRRRRIGSTGGMGGIVTTVGGLALGGAAGRELATLLGTFLPSLASNQILDGAIQCAVGYFLPKFVKGQFVQMVGYGMIASGGQTILVGTGIINGAGIGRPGNVMSYQIGGTSNLRVINGTSNLKVVGYPGDNRIQNQPAVGRPVHSRNFNVYG